MKLTKEILAERQAAADAALKDFIAEVGDRTLAEYEDDKDRANTKAMLETVKSPEYRAMWQNAVDKAASK